MSLGWQAAAAFGALTVWVVLLFWADRWLIRWRNRRLERQQAKEARDNIVTEIVASQQTPLPPGPRRRPF